MDKEFDKLFLRLTGNPPFPWQQALFGKLLQSEFPSSCNIPTGLGKTSVIAIWLLALAEHAHAARLARFPRRLVYVVNRRTVVDQATREAERMRKAIGEPGLEWVEGALQSLSVWPTESPLAISTLRGQFADNAEWRNDPSRPAVIVGTVDMIGSRLLFAGYGCGFKSRPLHAGFLGQHTLLVHDEAHLEPAFQELIAAIKKEQDRCDESDRFHVMELTATSRSGAQAFQLTDADRDNDVVRERIGARKGLAFFSVDDEKKLADRIVDCALEHKESGQAILIFLRELKNVERVVDKLKKARQPVQVLTGTMRGLERDRLPKSDAIFARFMPRPEVETQRGTVYLVCTSAGEVGVDISADHMVCDLSPFDSMAQRLGRVNRFGKGDAKIDVIHVIRAEKAQPSAKLDEACEKTLALLQRLPWRQDDQRHDASPAALGDLPVAARLAAYSPRPVILPVSDILFDSWALTTIRQQLPGRPPVADWLHGVADWEPKETYVAWRSEVGIIKDGLETRYAPVDLLEDYPLKPHELLRGRTDRVFDALKKLAVPHAESPVWLVAGDGSVKVQKLSELNDEKALEGSTVLLPLEIGGLDTDNGTLDGDAAFDPAGRYDVADELLDPAESALRCRVWEQDGPDKMRLVRSIDTGPEADDEPDAPEPRKRYWNWYVLPQAADDDGSRTAREPQKLATHLQDTLHFAKELVARLGLKEPEAAAVQLAAWWHDQGKSRRVWQRSIGNRDYPDLVLAKSDGKRMRPIDLSRYRHEFGSLIDVSEFAAFRDLDPGVQDLVLHLIAAHHGRARPHFPADEAFDPESPDEVAAAFAREVPRRYARLQRKYGRWGLAYLESLVRAADALASQNPRVAATKEDGR